MVGSAILRRLKAEGYTNIITRAHAELDLTNQQAVRDFFRSEKIDYVVLAAAKVGGIHANNSYPAEFIYQNIMIEANVIHEACKAGVQRLLFLGSSCIYPKHATQPMKEEYLLTGLLEPTNEPYAIAKIAGIKLCESYNRQYGTKYRSIMPTNLYGPNDNFDLENSHVLPALIRKFHLAKLAAQGDWEGIKRDEEIFGPIDNFRTSLKLSPQSSVLSPNSSDSSAVVLWGSGTPRREFLHVDDLADACLFLMNINDKTFDLVCSGNSPSSPVLSPNNLTQSSVLSPQSFMYSPKSCFYNIGTGKDITIKELAQIIKKVTGYAGKVNWDNSKPDGTPRKLLDITKLNNLGWKPKISLKEGIKSTYDWYLKQIL